MAGRTVTVTGADTDSGVASLEYRLDDGAWTAYTAPLSLDTDAHTVEVRATDHAGNVSETGTLEVPALRVGVVVTSAARAERGRLVPRGRRRRPERAGVRLPGAVPP